MSTVAARELATLRAQVAQLTARVAALEQQVPRRPSDTELITAIAKATEGRAFSARELHRHARLVDSDLLTLLQSVEARTPIKIGLLLRCLSQITTRHFRLVRVARDAAGIVWEVRVSVGGADLHEGHSVRQDRSV